MSTHLSKKNYLTKYIKILSKSLISVSCATMCSKSEVTLITNLPTTLGVKFDMRFMAQDLFGELNISMPDHMALNLKFTVYILGQEDL